MATYAIGDLQGCYDSLMHLLDLIDYNPSVDRLWFAGDIVNRGPQSLQCLRFIYQLERKQKKAVMVLGNHDLHLLALATEQRKSKSQDTLQDILCSDDRDELLSWLRQQPLLYQQSDIEYTMVHAGLAPQWDITLAISLAREVETVLQSDEYANLLANMYGDVPAKWSDQLTGMERWRFIINSFTRMRYCTSEGALELTTKLKPSDQNAHLIPWFQYPARASKASKIIFGHWSTLGMIEHDNTYGLDTGCVWGGKLTAMRIDTEVPTYFNVSGI